MGLADANSPAIDPLLPSAHRVTPRDVELFQRRLQGFIPRGAFDVHAHLYPLAATGLKASDEEPDAGLQLYRRLTSQWMGEAAPAAGLFFGMPRRDCDVDAVNRFVSREAATAVGSGGLMLIRPQDDPAIVEEQLRDGGFLGLKVYHCFADSANTMEANLDEYLPRWSWELAHARGLAIMLHLVRAAALADESNQRTLQRRLREYPNAKLILAHAGRGFCAPHTLDGLEAMASFDNVFFDTSAICEPLPFAAILQRCGPSRLMFGTDFPVCMFRGRVVSIAEGFYWLFERNLAGGEATHAQPTLVGIESLLALRQAAQLLQLTDADLELIFGDAARSLLGLA